MKKSLETIECVPSNLRAKRLVRTNSSDPFEALGDSHRRSIVELLGHRERTVREIAEALPISRPAVSRHLKLLKNAGLVVDEPHGTRRVYRLHDEGVEVVQEYLTQVWGEAIARYRLAAENTSRKK